MFAILELEQNPLSWQNFPPGLYQWIEAAGGFAAVGLVLWLIFRLIRSQPLVEGKTGISLRTWVLGSLLLGIVVAILPALCFILWDGLGLGGPTAKAGPRASWTRHLGKVITNPEGAKDFLFLPSALALAAVLVPFLFDLAKLRWRRIWGLAKLSFKEAIRRRILWAFSVLLLLFLFASWFIRGKPEDQVRNYVEVVYGAMALLLLITAGLLACLSLPTDLRNQTIHTILTKPVERFEIIAGRFLGFTFLMTIVLAAMSLASLIYVARGVDDDAREESFKARIPVYGDLRVQSFKEGQIQEGGKSVGREWNYRQYISGGVKSGDEKATWTFHDLPSDLATKDSVRCEFGFDIFRTTKGKYENKGVECTFTFMNWKCEAVAKPELEKELSQQFLQKQSQPGPIDQANKEFAGEKGFYEARNIEVTDYHTLGIYVPGELFRDLPELSKQKGERLPALTVVVRLEDLNQLLGVAKYDLYLLEDEGKNSFSLNFLKGAMGLWFRLCLVIVVGVTCSTFLSGIIAALVTLCLYLGGIFVEFVRDVASGQTTGGGPLEAFIRLQENKNLIVPLDESTPTVMVALWLDKIFEWVLRRILNLLPDVSRFNLTKYVAQGFDIAVIGRDNSLVLDGLILVAYLLPWVVLGYYLMKSREIAA